MKYQHNVRKILFLLLLITVLATLIGCAGEPYKPRYSEPIDTFKTQNTQIAYSGFNFEILWNKDSVSGATVSLNLYRGKSFLMNIDSYVYNGGYYAWTIPDSLDWGNNYRIRITISSDSTHFLYTPFISLESYSQVDSYEPDNMQYQATPISVSGIAQMHAISTADIDWFSFKAIAQSIYIIQTFGGSDILIALYTEGGKPIANENDDIYRVKKTVWRCDSSATCFLKISSQSSNPAAAYQVTVKPYTPLKNVIFKYPDSGAILVPGSIDTLVWETSDSGALVSVTLIGKSNLMLESSTKNTGKYTWNVPRGLDSSTIYRIRISDAQYSPSTFISAGFYISLKADNAETDNSPAQASALIPGAIVTNRTITLNDSDWYSFNAEKGKVYSFVTTGMTDMRLTLFGRDGMSVLRRNDDGFSSDKNAQVLWSCDTAGRYFLMTQGFSSSTTGLYGLKFDTIARPILSVQVPAPICTAGTSVQIEWKNMGLSRSLLRVDLFKDSMVKFLGTGATNSSLTWPISQELKNGNDYRIKVCFVSDTSISAFSPVFQIVSMADAFEPDNSLSKADTTIVFGTAQQHTLPPNDSDWIAFHALEGRAYSIGITGINSVFLSLHSSNGNTIASDDKYSADYQDAKISFICASSGTYYALVRKYNKTTNWNYEIVIFNE